ncbi:Nuclear export mediator factor NEMF [Taenia crassiceps]|uniref:Nuclear export mediator factor NEMF n=1 Tax=Taenia crassiceps TaxID=6207 RepID=A0ABR4QFL0_9CEST
MKARFETFDVIAVVSELKNSIIGYRLVNAYDINNKTYLLKLSSSSSDEKLMLFIESGVRMNLTSFSWSKNTMPNAFAMKLRKHIKNKKISDIQQLGIDRLVNITFGFEQYAFRLLVELYGKGNIFLTDANYTILHLLRPRTDVDQDVRYAARERFPIELARPVPACLVDLRDSSSFENLVKAIADLLIGASGPWNTDPPDKSTECPSVVSVLSNVFSYGTGLIEHCCFLAGLSNFKRRKAGGNPEANVQVSSDSNACRLDYSAKIARALREVLLQISEKRVITNDGTISTPAVILGVPSTIEPGKLNKYDSYYPLRFAHLSSKPGIEFASFNKAVDEFYSSLEIQRNEAQSVQTAKSANKKLENIKRDQEQRIKVLREEQISDNQKAQLLEMNMDLVDKVIMTLNSAIANQTSWRVLEEVLEKQKERGDDPVANCIVRLQLASNQAVLRLSNLYADDEDEEATTQEVLVDLDSTAFQNAKKYYTHRRQAEAKERKTIAGTAIALKAASKKAEKTRKGVREAPKLTKTRKPLWFEKFHWFISSDNYLVLAGRDDVQNETLFKRYFRQHDIYVHADVHGASSVIVKARALQACEKSAEDIADNTTAIPQPPMRTLFEAGHMAIALSNAWSAKVITNAWWVRYDQVSKTAPSGEYLPTGSFVIRGRKNVLPQCLLTYGIGILFKLGDDSVDRHIGERCIDLESVAESKAILKRYDITPQTDGNAELDEEEEDDVAKAFGNVTLNLNISRVKKPQSQAVQQRKKANPCMKEMPPSRPQPKAKSTGPNPLKRGQKAKMKRIRQKYADQDDEERQMRQRILQGAGGKLSAVHAIGKAPQPEGGEVAVVGDVDFEEKQEEHSLPRVQDDEVKENSEVADEKEEATVRVPELEENDLKDDSAATLGELSVLGTLTGQPMAEDSLLFALPFCAPFSALQKFKYKAKLLPGVQKKGEITRMAIRRFTMDKEASDLEKQLIQAIREEDVCRVLPGSAKIAFLDVTSRPVGGRGGSLTFPAYNISFPCSQDYSFIKDLVCYRFALALTRHPSKTVTCHVHGEGVEESRSFRHLFLQPGNTHRLLPLDSEIYEDELSFVEGVDDSEIHLLREIASYMEPPNITISAIECNHFVNVTCTAPLEPVELYTTSSSSDLKRCNGSWADLSSDRLSLLNFSVNNYMDVFIARASIRRIVGEDQFVVCRYLEKYDYSLLPVPECSMLTGRRTFGNLRLDEEDAEAVPCFRLGADPLDAFLRLCLIVVCHFAILLLAALTFWCWYLRRRRRQKRQAIAALIYRHDATLSINAQHSYVNATDDGNYIYTKFSHSSGSDESSQQVDSVQQSSVEYSQEIRELEQSKLGFWTHLNTHRLRRQNPRPSLQWRHRRREPVSCCCPSLPILYRSVRGKGVLTLDHARKYSSVPLGRLRKSLVWFRRLRQVEALLHYYIRMPKSAKLLLLLNQKRRAKALVQPR